MEGAVRGGAQAGVPSPAPPLLSLPAAYQVSHRLNTSAVTAAAVEVLEAGARQFTATGLQPEATYLFRVTAQTRKGWGEAAEALVVTTEKRGNHGGARLVGGAGGAPAVLPAPRLPQPGRSPPGSRWRSRRRCGRGACCCPGSRAATASPPCATTPCRAESCPTASGPCTPPPSATTPPPSSWTGEGMGTRRVMTLRVVFALPQFPHLMRSAGTRLGAMPSGREGGSGVPRWLPRPHPAALPAG